MFEKRKHTRYPTLAKVSIPGVSESEAVLKDLSITGCCVEYTVFMDFKKGSQYKALILPDGASRIEKFELELECRWIHSAGYSYEIGFSVIAFPKGKEFQRYVDYLAWRTNNVP
jgi:hypothetical protein